MPIVSSACGAMLIFADDAGHVRQMTQSERDAHRVHPDVQHIYDSWKVNHVRQPDFTKKRFN